MQKQESCCPKGSWPALTLDYRPAGKTFNIEGVKIYHMGEWENRPLVLISDIFGIDSGRHYSVADTFASQGFNVFLPEIIPVKYEGQAERTKLIQFIKEMDQDKVGSNFNALVNYLQSNGIKEFFVAGFCWGVWKSFHFASKLDCITAIAGFHPSIVLQQVMGKSEAQLTKSLRCPAFLMPAGNDVPNIKVDGQLVKILSEKFKQKARVKQFDQMVHGWVVRGDINEPAVARDVKSAITLAVDYFASFTHR